MPPSAPSLRSPRASNPYPRSSARLAPALVSVLSVGLAISLLTVDGHAADAPADITGAGTSTLADAQSASASAEQVAQQPAPAADESVNQVVVTAERRAESITNVPISITAISSSTIEKFDIQDFADYAEQVPNLSFGLGVGAGGMGVAGATGISIRGIAGNDTTAFYIDDTPLPDSLDPRILDIDHIEVLRGPQGTLFGASSMGGLVRVITQQPNSSTFSSSVDVQGYDLAHAGRPGGEASAVFNIPLVPELAAIRLSTFDSYQPGYFTRTYDDPLALNVTGQPVPGPTVTVNNVGAVNQDGFGATLRITPVDDLVLTPLFRWQKSIGVGFPLADYEPDNLVQRRILNQPENYQDSFLFGAFTAGYTVPFGRFVSSTSLFHRETYSLEDGADANSVALSPTLLLPAPGTSDVHTRTFTEEDRFESSFDVPLQVVTGAFYQVVNVSNINLVVMPGLDSEPGSPFDTNTVWYGDWTSRTTQLAGYVGLTYTPYAPLAFEIGARESRLTNDSNAITGGVFGTGPALANESQSAFTPRYSIKYHLDPLTLLYATAAKGFREGGANAPLGAACTGFGFSTTEAIPYGSDDLWSYELGVKEATADNRFSVSADVYHINWSKIQQNESLSNGTNGCFAGLTLNLGTAKSDGSEIEANARVTEHLFVHLAAGYEDARLTEVAPGTEYYVGEGLNGVPRWTGSASTEYQIPQAWGNYFVRGQYSYTGHSISYTEIPTGLPRESYQLIDLRLGANYSAYEVTLFAKNLLDAKPNLSDEVPVTALAENRYRYWVGLPREVGLDLRYRF